MTLVAIPLALNAAVIREAWLARVAAERRYRARREAHRRELAARWAGEGVGG